MKVYRALRDVTFTGPVYKIMKKGELLYQDGDCYLAESGYYPISKIFVEGRPTDYERLQDDDHEAGYYLNKVYTQYQYDTKPNE